MFKLFRPAAVFTFVLCIFGAHASEVPLEDYFKHSEFDNASLSPTGDYLAVSVPSDRKRNLVVLDITDPSTLNVTAAFALSGGESPTNIRWVSPERLIFGTQIQVGPAEQPRNTGRIFAMNYDGGNRRQLFGTEPGSFVFRFMEVLSYLPDEPDWILIQHWAHDRERPRAERLNVNRPRTRGVAVSPLSRGHLMVDHNNDVRFAIGANSDGDPEFSWRPTVDDEWRSFANDLSAHLQPIAFDESGEYVYVSVPNEDRMGIHRIQLASGEHEALLTSENVQVDNGSSLKFSADQRRLLGARFMDGVPRWYTLDDDAHEVQWLRQLEAMYEGHLVNITNWTSDGKRAVVNISSDVAPAEYFLLDTEAPELRFLGASRPWIDPQQMQPMQPISLQASDGLELHGYMTLPPEYEEGSAVPFIVWVHGGPHGIRDSWGFYPRAQMFANNGFGVLQVNYRGSGGYGREFEHAGHLEWGGAMQQDITDATKWAIEQGFAKEDAVCLGGGSYGGYSTLSGITQQPDLYACAFAFVGVYDLELMKTVGNVPSFAEGRRYLDMVLGTDEEVLRERSPTNYVANIKTPLFIAHGAEDRQAHVDNYFLLKERLDEAGIEYESLLVEDEGHGFYEVDNNVMMFEQVLEFMKQHTSSAD